MAPPFKAQQDQKAAAVATKLHKTGSEMIAAGIIPTQTNVASTIHGTSSQIDNVALAVAEHQLTNTSTRITP